MLGKIQIHLALCLLLGKFAVNGFQVRLPPPSSSSPSLPSSQHYPGFTSRPQSYTTTTASPSYSRSQKTSVSTALYSTTPPRRPRRALQKRRKTKRTNNYNNGNNNNNNPNQDAAGSFRVNTSTDEDDFPWDTAESRPLVKSEAQELGEDYWIDEKELQKLAEARKPPVRLPGQVTDEKLWQEVLSPYKQNWIGLASVVVVVLAVIVSQFPELLQTPIIAIPDL